VVQVRLTLSIYSHLPKLALTMLMVPVVQVRLTLPIYSHLPKLALTMLMVPVVHVRLTSSPSHWYSVTSLLPSGPAPGRKKNSDHVSQ
jgi:hypothetical protein